MIALTMPLAIWYPKELNVLRYGTRSGVLVLVGGGHSGCMPSVTLTVGPLSVEHSSTYVHQV